MTVSRGTLEARVEQLERRVWELESAGSGRLAEQTRNLREGYALVAQSSLSRAVEQTDELLKNSGLPPYEAEALRNPDNGREMVPLLYDAYTMPEDDE